jgi:hypothetical protein
MTPRPRAIGVGYELGRLETIHPQGHDMPMDAIVTEAGVFEAPARRGGAAFPEWDEDPSSTGSFASPPCFMHELDPSWLGLEPERPGNTDRPDPRGEGKSAYDVQATGPASGASRRPR